MKLAIVTINRDSWAGSEVLWTKTAKLALEEGHEVLISMFETDKLPAPIQEVKDLGAQFYFRKRYYPPFKDRLQKKLKNKVAADGNKSTYHDYIIDFGADSILFSLGGGDEMARDTDDLMVFVQQTKIPYFIYCHSVSTIPENNEELSNNLRISFSKAQNVFFTSHHQKEMYEHQIIDEIPNGIVSGQPLNLKSIGYLDLNPTDTYNMAMVGGLVVRWKGQDIALKALSGEQWKSRSFILNIYGNGDDEAMLKKYVQHYGLEDKVRFHGYANSMEDIWRENHIHLIPSRQDSGPITLLEGICSGRTAVGTRMGAIPRFVVEGETGFLAEPGSYQSYADALERAWQQREDWLRMGKQALVRAQELYDFTPDKTMLGYLTNKIN